MMILGITMTILIPADFPSNRTQIVKAGLLPKLVPLIEEEQQRTVVLCLLYHLSMEDRCKSMFTYTDCVPLVRGYRGKRGVERA